MGKIYRKKTNYSRKRATLKDIIAGVFSPNTAATKLQGLARSRTIRQGIKKDKLLSLFSQGATKYKSAIQQRDFRGIDMNNQTLSRRVLDNANFEKVKFTNSRLNGCKMNNIKARGAIFTNAELKKSIANNADFTGADFNSADLREFNSKDGEFKNAIFNKTKLDKANFQNCNLDNSIFDDALVTNNTSIKNCSINGITVTSKIHYNNFISNLFQLLLKNNDNDIQNLKMINTYHIKTTIPNLLCSNKTFKNLHLKNLLIRSSSDFYGCLFNKGIFEQIQVHDSTFRNCNFMDIDFKEFVGHSSFYTNTEFRRCNFTNADLRQSRFTNCDFIDCDLTSSRLVRTNIQGSKFNQGCILRNVDFQECGGMENFSFRGADLQGARLVGINLRGADFRGANLRGVQFDFSEIHGSDFTDADLQNANVGVAEGRYETVGIPADLEDVAAVDTHKTFYEININRLIVFLNDKLENARTDITSPQILREHMKTTIANILNNFVLPDDEKRVLVEGLNTCFRDRLDSYDFLSIIAGTEPRKTFMDLLVPTIQYLEQQSKEFRELYAQALILDSINAHGTGGLSCAAGIIERFVTVLKQSAAVIKDSETSKAEEYNELINIIDNNPRLLIKQYQQEWFEFHKEGGPNTFSDDETLDVIMESYERFLREKFDIDAMRDGTKKTRLLNLIEEHEEAGTRITREYIDNMVLFFGGSKQSKHSKHSKHSRTSSHKENKHKKNNIFKLLKDRFYLKPDRLSRSHNRMAGKARATGKARTQKQKRQYLVKNVFSKYVHIKSKVFNIE